MAREEAQMDEQRYERVVWGGGLLLEDERILIVCNHWPEGEVWALPGGFSPPGELLSETVRRELREEAGLTVEIGSLAYVVENFWPPDDRGVSAHALAFVFRVRALNGPASPQDPDGWVQEVRWVPVAELEPYLEPARRHGWRGFWEPLLDCIGKRSGDAQFYSYDGLGE
jgi:8-oxo-dGTP diphosphatase